MRWLPTIFLFALALGCKGPAGLPFGGPYGGETEPLAPTDGGYDNTDSTFRPPVVPREGGNVVGDPPTWTDIYSIYLASGTIGYCTDCHPEMSDAPASFTWLEEHGYVGGPDPVLTNLGSSCLSWYGGNMPPGAPVLSEDAVKHMDAWAKAGGPNN
jgi:hypothetical protein